MSMPSASTIPGIPRMCAKPPLTGLPSCSRRHRGQPSVSLHALRAGTRHGVYAPARRADRSLLPSRGPGLFYLPYKRTEKGWEEFPQEIDQYQIRTVDGPRSQKDGRYGRPAVSNIRPCLSDPRAYYSRFRAKPFSRCVSPYVIIDARFSLELDLASRRGDGANRDLDRWREELGWKPAVSRAHYRNVARRAARRGAFDAWSPHGSERPLRVSREDQDG